MLVTRICVSLLSRQERVVVAVVVVVVVKIITVIMRRKSRRERAENSDIFHKEYLGQQDLNRKELKSRFKR